MKQTITFPTTAANIERHLRQSLAEREQAAKAAEQVAANSTPSPSGGSIRHMPIIARASVSTGENFVPAPVGLHRSICCDVVDLGMVAGQWGEKHKVRIIWQTETLMPDGRPYLVDQRYTLSLDERSNLRRDLEAWRGKPFTLTEAAGFDLERLIGAQCALLVVHKAGRDGQRVFANIQAVLPKQAGPVLTIRDYVRVLDRQVAPDGTPLKPQPIGPSHPPTPTGWPATLPERSAAAAKPEEITADSIPF